MRPLPTSILLALALGAVACGGGGGGTTMVQVTGENGAPLAARAYGVAQLADAMVVLAEGFGEMLDGADTPSCDAGSVDVAIDDAAPLDVVSTGDSVSVAFHACAADLGGETVLLDGSLVLAVTSAVESGPSDRRAAFDVAFHRLSMTSSSGTVTLEGHMTIEVAISGDARETAVTGDLTVVAESGGETVSLSLRDFRSEETSDEGTGDYSRSFSGTYASNTIGGAVAMETVAPLEGNDDTAPTAGEFHVHGAAGSEVRVVAVGGIGVRLFIDADGDGTPENTLDTTWNDLG